MTAIGATSGAKLDLGRVVSQTFGVIGRNAGGFLGLSAILVAAPMLVLGLLRLFILGPTIASAPQFSAAAILIGLGSFLVQVVGTSFLMVALLQATVTDLNGGKASPQAGLRVAASMLLPVIGLTIVQTIGIMLGFLLLIVPGVILMVMWMVTMPVLVVEKRDIFACLQRSRDLTRGSRWSLFFLSLAYLIAVWIVTALAAGLGIAIGAVSGPTFIQAATIVVTSLATLVTQVISATGVAVIYSELRAAKEGVRPDQLAALFD